MGKGQLGAHRLRGGGRSSAQPKEESSEDSSKQRECWEYEVVSSMGNRCCSRRLGLGGVGNLDLQRLSSNRCDFVVQSPQPSVVLWQ